MFKRILLFFLFLTLTLTARANFEFNSNCIKAYEQILSLRLNSAKALIAAEKKANPQNAIPILLDNYIDYFTLFTSDSKADFDRLKNNKSSRISRLEKEDKNSPYYLYSIAEVNLQWALTRGRFQEYMSSAVEINRAFNLLQDNAKKYPSFLPNQKDLGIINAVLGSLPDGVKRIFGTFGVRGNAQTGTTILKNLINTLPKSSYAHYYDEVVFYLAYIQIDLLHDTNAYNQIRQNTESIDSASLLKSYIRGYSALRTGHTDEAILTLSRRPENNAYEPYPYLDYLLGIAHMYKLDRNASVFLLRYIKNYKGDNYIKDAYQNLAWDAVLRNDIADYKQYNSLLKAKGSAIFDKDKQAVAEANDPVPNIDVLKGHLLFDGGYHNLALNALLNKKVSDFTNQRDKIEYCYRLARIYDETAKDDIAIKFYQFALNLGKNERYYYAANAALRIAMIYEKRKNFSQAESYYRAAIAMKKHDYEESIESKAKEGLKRVS